MFLGLPPTAPVLFLFGHIVQTTPPHRKASCEWSNLWDIVANLDFKLAFTLSFYTIQLHSRPIPEFRPDIVLASKMQGVADHEVWPPPPPTRSVRQQRRPRRPPSGDVAGEQGQDQAIADDVGDVVGAGRDHPEEPHGPDLLADALADEEPDEAQIPAELFGEPANELFAEIDESLDLLVTGADKETENKNRFALVPVKASSPCAMIQKPLLRKR